MMRNFWALPVLLRVAVASQHAFSVNDDVLAFPQYEVKFTEDYLSETQAQSRLLKYERSGESHTADSSDVALHQQKPGGSGSGTSGSDAEEDFDYDVMMLNGQQYLCHIPTNDISLPPEANDTLSKRDEETELARANERGWELLQEMQGHCVYFWSGWWSYRYCYGEGVKQFHQLPPQPGMAAYPPLEDPTITGFMLGSIDGRTNDKAGDAESVQGKEVAKTENNDESASKAVGHLETRGDTRYLVQRLGGGTLCDLTRQPRRIEVQFHCNLAAHDHISLIKEVATCAYLMVIQTPRLCNDVAFLPPQKDHPNTISCSPIISEDKIPEYTSKVAASAKQALASQFPNPFEPQQSDVPVTVGGIVVGAHKWIEPGKEIEKSAIVGGGKETLVETIADSLGKMLSPEQLKKMGLGDPETVELLKKRLDKIAGKKGWKLDVVDTPKGREYRGVIDDDDEQEGTAKKGSDKGDGVEKTKAEEKGTKKESSRKVSNAGSTAGSKPSPEDPGQGDEEGSEETFKDEL